MISFFKKMYLLIFIVSASMSTANAAETIINHASAISPISSSDFTVQINNHPFALGATWNESAKKNAGVQLSESFTGEIPSGESSYKYYQHHYDGYDVYSSNLLWDKQNRDIDSYIIAQITLNKPGVKTARGISVGDSKVQLESKYGSGAVDDSDNQYWLYYDGDGKRILFQIERGKVSHIMMVFNIDD